MDRIFPAASALPDALQERYFGDAGFRSLRGMRNRMAHNYLDIDEDILWDSISIELPAVYERIAQDAAHARQLIESFFGHLKDELYCNTTYLTSTHSRPRSTSTSPGSTPNEPTQR